MKIDESRDSKKLDSSRHGLLEGSIAIQVVPFRFIYSKQKKLTSTFHRASICTIDLNLVFNLVSLMMGYLKRMSTEATQIVCFFHVLPKRKVTFVSLRHRFLFWEYRGNSNSLSLSLKITIECYR